MKSATLPSFWEEYHNLPHDIRQQARKAYQLWRENPWHRSLYFKCVNKQENIWSIRISRSHRALGILDGDVVNWFWIGGHDNYESFF